MQVAVVCSAMGKGAICNMAKGCAVESNTLHTGCFAFRTSYNAASSLCPYDFCLSRWPVCMQACSKKAIK